MKRERHVYRRTLLRHLGRHWRKCWWTWPLGHDWASSGGYVTINSTNPARVTTCRDCGKPYSLSSFDVDDIEDLYEQLLGGSVHPHMSEPEKLALIPDDVRKAHDAYWTEVRA